jgi:hypothetical protein
MVEAISGGLMALGGGVKAAWVNSRLERYVTDMEGKKKINDLLQKCVRGAEEYGDGGVTEGNGAGRQANAETGKLRTL